MIPLRQWRGVLSCITCLDPLGPLWIVASASRFRQNLSVSSKPDSASRFRQNHSVSSKPSARLHLPSRGYFGTLHVPTSDRVTLALSERRGALLSNHSQRPSNQDKVPPYRQIKIMRTSLLGLVILSRDSQVPWLPPLPGGRHHGQCPSEHSPGFTSPLFYKEMKGAQPAKVRSTLRRHRRADCQIDRDNVLQFFSHPPPLHTLHIFYPKEPPQSSLTIHGLY